MTLEDRLIKLETIVELYIKKIVDGLDVLSSLESEAQEAKVFRDTFPEKTKTIINERLNTTTFDKSIKQTTREEIAIYLLSKESAEDFSNRVNDLIDAKLKEVLLKTYIKITAIATTIAVAVAVSIIKSMI